MDVGRDRAGGGRSDAEDDGDEEADPDLDLDLEGALEGVSFGEEAEDDDMLEETDDGNRHRSVGESDVDAVFDEFDEASPEEVMAAVESVEDEPEAESDGHEPAGPVTAEPDDDEVESLFGDLSAVELDPDAEGDAEPPGTPGGRPDAGTADPASSDAGTGGATEERDPDEMAEEVEGLFDDLSAVDLEPEPEPAGATASATAETQETVLDTGAEEPSIIDADAAGASAFDWLGEDVHIFPSGESDVEGMFEEFEESSPEELIADADAGADTGVEATSGSSGDPTPSTSGGTTATAPAPSTPGRSANTTFGALERGTAVPDGRSPPATAPGWRSNADATNGHGPTASELFDELSVDPPQPSRRSPGPEGSRPERPQDEVAVEELDLSVDDLEAARETGTAPEDAVEAEADVDAVFERFDESSPEEIIAAAEDPAARTRIGGEAEEAVERLFGDLSDVDLEPGPGRRSPETTAPTPDPGSPAARSEVEGLLADLSEVDLRAEATAGSADAGKPASAGTAEETGHDRPEPAGVDPGDGMLEQTGEDTHVAVGESDVDAVFERFDESSPEEIAEDAGPGGRDAPDEEPTGTDGPSATPGGEVDEPTADEATAGADSDDEDDSDAEDGSGGIVAKIAGIVSRIFGIF